MNVPDLDRAASQYKFDHMERFQAVLRKLTVNGSELPSGSAGSGLPKHLLKQVTSNKPLPQLQCFTSIRRLATSSDSLVSDKSDMTVMFETTSH